MVEKGGRHRNMLTVREEGKEGKTRECKFAVKVESKAENLRCARVPCYCSSAE